MTEEFAFHQSFRNRGAIHPDVRFLCQHTIPVKFPGHQLLTRAILSGYQHTRFGLRNFVHQTLQFLDRFAFAHNVGRLGITLLNVIFGHSPHFVKRSDFLHNDFNLIEGERFDDVIKSTHLHTRDRRLNGSVSGHHHYHRTIGLSHDFFKKVRSLTIRQSKVKEHQVERISRQYLTSTL